MGLDHFLAQYDLLRTKLRDEAEMSKLRYYASFTCDLTDKNNRTRCCGGERSGCIQLDNDQ